MPGQTGTHDRSVRGSSTTSAEAGSAPPSNASRRSVDRLVRALLEQPAVTGQGERHVGPICERQINAKLRQVLALAGLLPLLRS